MLVGEAAVVEDLEEQVPDRPGGLVELVEQHDRERVLANRGHERCSVRVDARVGEQAIEAVGALELAHVEADEPLGGPEQELGQCFRDLRLPGPRRADEQEDAEWAGRVGDARLDHRDAFDDGVDGLFLSQDAASEELARVPEMQWNRGVEHQQWQSARSTECSHEVRLPDLGLPFGRSFHGGGPDETEEIPRRRDAWEELLCKLVRAAQSLLGRGDVVAVVVEGMERDGDGLCLLERADLDQLKGGGEVRPLGEQALRGFRGGLGHDRQVARLDCGEEGVEHPEAAPVVLTGMEGRFEIREVPDHRPAAEAVDELLDPRLELADVDRSRLELRRRRLEHGHAVDAVDRCSEQGRLADSVLRRRATPIAEASLPGALRSRRRSRHAAPREARGGCRTAGPTSFRCR